MQYQALGTSSLKISRIGFGCMSLNPDNSSFSHLIHTAIDQGINYFDTADLYDKGVNESRLGVAIKEKRKDVIIGTKVGNQWRADGSGWDWNPRKEYVLRAAEESLKRLQTDYIDLYQLHGGTINDPIDETIEAFEQLKQQGKIRYYGISSIRPNVVREYVKRASIVSVMMQYSLLDRRPEEFCFPLLLENNIGVLARGTVAGGLLAGKPPEPYLVNNEQQVSKTSNDLKAILSRGQNEAQMSIAFALRHRAVTSAVVGIRTFEQLQDAVAAIKINPDERLNSLAESIPVNYYQEHR